MYKTEILHLNKEEQGYLIGFFFGDGCLYKDKWRHYKINFYLNPKKDNDIEKFLHSLLKKAEFKYYTMKNHGCNIVRLNSKHLYNYLLKIKEHVNEITDNRFWIGCISGLIDSDGYVCNGEIVISNKDKELLELIESKANLFNVKTNLWMQHTRLNNKIYEIWRLRIGTSFKYEEQYSRKIRRFYGGDFSPATHHSE